MSKMICCPKCSSVYNEKAWGTCPYCLKRTTHKDLDKENERFHQNWMKIMTKRSGPKGLRT